MDSQTKDILKIIKSGITNQSDKISGDLSTDKLLELAEKHQIFSLIHRGLFNCNVSIDEKTKKQLYSIAINEIYVNEQQLYYINKISDQFDKNNIDYILLKGSVLKHLYPQPEIRRMSDIDILIKKEQYKKISKTLTALGFSFQYESNHEIVWAKNNIVLELHKMLIPSYNTDFHKYFRNGWKRAVKSEGHKYTFSDEDMFIYIFCHFAKHYRDAGIGIIHMCDLYIFLQAKKLNFDYVNKELKTLKLYDFYCNIKNTLDVWFCGKENSEITDFITKVIFSSGAYGLHKTSMLSSALKEKKRFKKITSMHIPSICCYIFPSYTTMKSKYKILRKLPVLLPFTWIWRFINILFIKRKKILEKINYIKNVDDQQIKEYENSLKYVGLDYFF